MPQHTVKLMELRMAPRKVRAVADLVRGLPVNEAEARLLLDRHRAARPLLKLLRSALTGAKAKQLNPEALYIESIRVDQGPMLKRWMARAQGRGAQIQRKTSHVFIGLGENPAQKAARFDIVRPVKKSKTEGEAKPKAPRKKPAAAAEPPEEKKPQKPGFFKRAFGRKSGEA